MTQAKTSSKDFIHLQIDEEVTNGLGRVAVRFPPEPNGYLHIGHAKAINLNFKIASKYGGHCTLRFDDTNPTKEEIEYIDAIQEDINWLGFKWNDVRFASDYFDQLYEWAVRLIKMNKAYVDSESIDLIRKKRSNPTNPAEAGIASEFRNRSIEENLELLARMKNGEFSEGEHVLRAKIDLAHPNFNMRDPIMMRILNIPHHRTGNKWKIYPTYDWAHGQSDSVEGITHSLCTLEFEHHRPLYDWFIETLQINHPKQIEFARLNLTYTVLSKRKLADLVKEGHVQGWDDPRMPTLCGMRRRGYLPESINRFCETIGISKANSTIDFALLEHHLREDLNKTALRVMGVLKPLKVIIENYPEGKMEEFDFLINPEKLELGTRKVPFSRELYIEQDDFLEEAPKKFFRLSPGKEVRLRYAYFITCQEVVKDGLGNIIEVRCTYDPDSKGGKSPDGRKVKGTLHWVSIPHAVPIETRLYNQLFSVEVPTENWRDDLNPNSIEIITAYTEPFLETARGGEHYQLERIGYFYVDPIDSTYKSPILNRIVTLKDSFPKPTK